MDFGRLSDLRYVDFRLPPDHPDTAAVLARAAATPAASGEAPPSPSTAVPGTTGAARSDDSVMRPRCGDVPGLIGGPAADDDHRLAPAAPSLSNPTPVSE